MVLRLADVAGVVTAVAAAAAAAAAATAACMHQRMYAQTHARMHTPTHTHTYMRVRGCVKALHAHAPTGVVVLLRLVYESGRRAILQACTHARHACVRVTTFRICRRTTFTGAWVRV